MELEERIEVHRLFWQGEAPRPLLGFFITGGGRREAGQPRYPHIDIDTPTADVVEKYRRSARAQRRRPGERVPGLCPNYGTSFLPALAGAEYRHDGHTSWCIPTGPSAAEIEIPGLDRDLPLWRSYADKLRALVEADIPGALVATGALTGPMEALLGLLGPEQLFLDMYDAPEAVQARAREFGRLWEETFRAQWEILGRPAGNVGFGVFIPGRSCLFTEDGLAFVGPDQFERFFREPVRQIARLLEVPFIHTHSAGIDCYPPLTEVDELRGVEISNDPNGPPLEELIEAGVRLQSAGKSVMFSNWMRPLSEEQVDRLLHVPDPGRTLITLTVESEAEARRYLRAARGVSC